jgi:hypothetical protein
MIPLIPPIVGTGTGLRGIGLPAGLGFRRQSLLALR